MARRIVQLCDRHLLDGIEISGTEHTYSYDGQDWVLATCDGCHDEVVKPLVELLREQGQPVAAIGVPEIRKGRPQVSGVREQCLWCPLTYSISGLREHLREKHGFSDMLSAFGMHCPVCGQENVRMWGTHAKRHHADLGGGVTALFIWARDHSDPHGVYAERVNLGRNVEVDQPPLPMATPARRAPAKKVAARKK